MQVSRVPPIVDPGWNDSHTSVLCYKATRITSNGIWVGEATMVYTLPVYLLQAAVMLSLIILVQFLLKPLKQASIVSNIIAGMLLGPSVLGKYEPFSTKLFPVQNLFVMKMIAHLGLMYYLFLVGVKTDPSLVFKGRKHVFIAATGIALPLLSTYFLLRLTSDDLARIMKTDLFSAVLATMLSLTSFPVTHSFLSDFKLLNSELGRLSLSTAMFNDIIGWLCFVLFQRKRGGQMDASTIAYYSSALAALIIFLVCLIRPIILWLARHTPEGKPVEQTYIVAILMGVPLMGFISDALGLSTVAGPLLYGLIIQEGPPVGSTLTQKTESVVQLILLPAFFASFGRRFDFYVLKEWTSCFLLVFIISVSKMAKLLGTMVSAASCSVSLHDAFTLGLIMNARGFIDVTVYIGWTGSSAITEEAYTTFVLMVVIMNAFLGPLVIHQTQMSRRGIPNARHTIQHLKPNSELRVLACIHDQDCVVPIINLLEVTHPTEENSIYVGVMHLVELVGRATPMLIAHRRHKKSTISSTSNAIFAAFQNYERYYNGNAMVMSFTSVAPYHSMHNDICSIALEKKVSLIVIPFHKQQSFDGGLDKVVRALQIINPNILAKAPCSVGILVCRGNFSGSYACANLGNSTYRICVIFLGGADDREALSYASRMAEHPKATLTVVRFLSMNDDADNPKERQLDDDLVSYFKMKSMNNERVVYKEEMVHDALDIVNLIRSEESVYDLMVVGRQQDTNTELVAGLSVWSENPELGVMGDLCCSLDFFGGMASVLVVQQQLIINHGIQDTRSSNSTQEDSAGENMAFLNWKTPPEDRIL